MRIFLKTEFKIFITIALILMFYTSHYGGSYIADSMLATTQAVIDKGSVIIDSYVKPGCINTTSKSLYGCDHAFYDGHWYSGFPPGPSFLALPSYLILKPFTYLIPEFVFNFPKAQIKTIILNIIATLLIIIPLSGLVSVILYKITKKFLIKKQNRILTSLLFSFGTLFFYYSTKFDARVLATFFSFTSFYILFKNRTEKIRPLNLFIAGIFAAISVTMEYIHIIIFFALFLYIFSFLRNKKIFYFIIGTIIPLLLMLCYHYSAFDSPFRSGYNFRQGMDAGVTENTFSNFTLINLWAYTFSPRYGLFFYMPILLLCVYGLYIGFKERKEFWREFGTVTLIFISYLVIHSSFISEGVCTFGPRYFIGIIPFVFISLPLAIEKVGKIITLIIGGISIFINYLPVLYVVGPVGCTPGIGVLKFLISEIPKKGLTNYTFNLINQVLTPLNYFWVNFANIIILSLIGFIIYKIWKSKRG